MYKKILVPLDGSEVSESVLSHVVTIATNCNVPEVVLIRVREPLDSEVFGVLDPKVAMQLDEAYRDEPADYLEKIAETLREKKINVKIEVPSGNPAEEIMEYAKSNEVDLIIMSTHGRSGVSRIFLGSVAEKVIRHSVAPVLINRASQKTA